MLVLHARRLRRTELYCHLCPTCTGFMKYFFWWLIMWKRLDFVSVHWCGVVSYLKITSANQVDWADGLAQNWLWHEPFKEALRPPMCTLEMLDISNRFAVAASLGQHLVSRRSGGKKSAGGITADEPWRQLMDSYNPKSRHKTYHIQTSPDIIKHDQILHIHQEHDFP